MRVGFGPATFILQTRVAKLSAPVEQQPERRPKENEGNWRMTHSILTSDIVHPSLSFPRPSVIIVEAPDIVLPEVRAALDFD